MIIFYVSLSIIIFTIITLLYCFCCCISVVNDYSEVRDEDFIIVNSPFDNILEIDIPSDIDCIEYDRD
jgi:hypothetical protein